MLKTLAFVLCASPAAAQSTITLRPDFTAPGQFATISHWNAQEMSKASISKEFETMYGTVTIVLHITPNIHCKPGCPDRLDVTGTPEGIIAIPDSINTPEDAARQIKLFVVAEMAAG